MKVVERVPCLGIEVSDDPYIALKLTWQVENRADTLYLMVKGVEGGYVELKVDSASGALVQLIVVDQPPAVRLSDSPPDFEDGQSCLTPALDLSLWPWKHTPDYSAPARKIARLESKLGMSVRSGIVTLLLSEGEAVEFIGGGPVRVGIGENGEMVCVAAVQG